VHPPIDRRIGIGQTSLLARSTDQLTQDALVMTLAYGIRTVIARRILRFGFRCADIATFLALWVDD